MAEAEDQGSQDRRPTPVRMAMDAAETQPEEAEAPDRHVRDPRTGQEWIARVSGRSRSGVVPLRIISLMEITFSRSEEPNRPLRRAICQGEALEDLGEADLFNLFKDSKPLADSNREIPTRERRGRRGRPRRGS